MQTFSNSPTRATVRAPIREDPAAQQLFTVGAQLHSLGHAWTLELAADGTDRRRAQLALLEQLAAQAYEVHLY